MSKNFAELIDQPFALNYRNFGEHESQLEILDDCNVLVLNIFTNCLREGAPQFLSIKDDEVSKAHAGILHFFLKILSLQPKPHNSKEDSKTPVYVFVKEELVPEEDPKKPWSKSNIPPIIAHRIWIFYRSLFKGKKWGEYLDLYFSHNQVEGMKRNWENVQPGELDYKLILNPGDYLKCINLINPINYKSKADSLSSMSFSNIGNKANPEIVFSIFKGMMQECDQISPEQRDIENYIEIDKDESDTQKKYYAFPFPHRCKRYGPDDVSKFLQLQIPPLVEEEDLLIDIKDNVNHHRMIQSLIQRGFGSKNKITGVMEFDKIKYEKYLSRLDEDERELAYSIDAEGVNEMFRGTIGIANKRKSGLDQNYWVTRHVKERSEIIEKWKKTCSEPEHKDKTIGEKQNMLTKAMNKFWDDCAKHFGYIWSKINEEQSSYKKSCIEFFNNFKEENQDKFFLKFNKTSTNMSLWEDFLCDIMLNLEHVYKVSTVHDKILIIWLCTLNASDPDRKRKFNLLHVGEAALGKSFAAYIGEEWCVPGTAQSYTYKTLRSDTSDGNFDGGISIMHELQRGWMGYSDRLKARGGANASGGGEAEAQFKERLTSGLVRVHEMVRDEKTGKRVERDIVRLSNGTFILTTNDNIYDFSSAMLSRFYCQIFPKQHRKGYEPHELMQLEETEDQKMIHREVTKRMNWIHCNVMIVNELIANGILTPVNTNYSGTMLLQVLHEAGRLGVPDVSNPRKMINIMCCVRAAVIVRACLLQFASSTNFQNPDGEKEYQFIDHIQTHGHLVDTDDSILISILGMLKDQYENPLHFYLLRAITKKYILNLEFIENVVEKYPDVEKRTQHLLDIRNCNLNVDRGFTTSGIHNKRDGPKKHANIDELMNAPDSIFDPEHEKIAKLSNKYANNNNNNQKKKSLIDDDISFEDLAAADDEVIKKVVMTDELKAELLSREKKMEDVKENDNLEMIQKMKQIEKEKERKEKEKEKEKLKKNKNKKNRKDSDDDYSDRSDEDSDEYYYSDDDDDNNKKNNKSLLSRKEKKLLSKKEQRELEALKKIEKQKEEREEKEREEYNNNNEDKPRVYEEEYNMIDWDDKDEYWERKVSGYPNLTYKDFLDYVPRYSKDKNYFEIRVDAIKPIQNGGGGNNKKKNNNNKKNNDSGDGSYYWEDRSISLLASDLLPIMPEKHTHADVVASLQSLCQVTRLTSKPKDAGESDDDYEKPFYIKDNYLYISRDLIRWNSKSKMEVAIKNVYQHHRTIPSTKIFGMKKMRDYYHVFDTIDLKRIPNKPFVINNAEYISQQTKETLNINLKNILRGQMFLTDDIENPDEDITTASHLNIDYSLAVSTFIRHIKSIGWNKSMTDELNVLPEASMNPALLAAYEVERQIWSEKMEIATANEDTVTIKYLKQLEPKELKPYPENLGLQSRKQLEDIRKTEMKDKNFKDKYSLRTKINRFAKAFDMDTETMNNLEQGVITEEQKSKLYNILRKRQSGLVDFNNKVVFKQHQQQEDEKIDLIDNNNNNNNNNAQNKKLKRRHHHEEEEEEEAEEEEEVKQKNKKKQNKKQKSQKKNDDDSDNDEINDLVDNLYNLKRKDHNDANKKQKKKHKRLDMDKESHHSSKASSPRLEYIQQDNYAPVADLYI